MASSLAIGNSLASRHHASMRKDLGACPELIPGVGELREALRAGPCRRNFGFQVKKFFFTLFMQYKLMFEVSCGIVRTLNDKP